MQVEKRYVIRVAGIASNNYIGIDSASGGYPYETDFWDCKKFSNAESAINYANADWGSVKKKDWEVYATDEVGMKFVEAKPDPYEAELAALKKKHNRT